MAASSLLITSGLSAQDQKAPQYPAYDLKAERIKLVNDAVKLTWKMDTRYTGEFVIGRSEKEVKDQEGALRSQLIGTFTSSQEGILIDRGLQQGKQYYYVVLTKDDLFKREIKILRDVNSTSVPVSIYTEPAPVDSLKAEISEESSVKITWSPSRGDGIRYNVYRSRSIISSRADLEVAERIATVETDSYVDQKVPEYGTSFYAVTITDRNSIEYFTPVSGKNFTTRGVYIKGRTLTTPLNTAAFQGSNDSIIIKWERGNSLTGREITGYEVYRSEEMIDSILRLKFAKIIAITDSDATLYTDTRPGPGKYYYAVFARYNDGTVDVSFDTDSNYTKSPIIIAIPYSITAMEAEVRDGNVVIKWNFTGNSGAEQVTLFKTKKRADNSGMLMPDSVIGTENIRTGMFTLPLPEEAKYYYGLFIRDDTRVVALKTGINITDNPIGLENRKSGDITEQKEPEKEEIKEPEKDITRVIEKEDAGETREDFSFIEEDTEESEELTEKTPEKEQKERSISSDLDYIIDELFYRERYHSAVKELKIFISKTDNKYEKARARLFLARTYIELEEYGKSIHLLNMDDVKTYFPDEAKFWSDFAMFRAR